LSYCPVMDPAVTNGRTTVDGGPCAGPVRPCWRTGSIH